MGQEIDNVFFQGLPCKAYKSLTSQFFLSSQHALQCFLFTLSSFTLLDFIPRNRNTSKCRGNTNNHDIIVMH